MNEPTLLERLGTETVIVEATNHVLDEIVKRIKEDGEYLIYPEHCVISFRMDGNYFKFWDENDPENTCFYDHDLLNSIPMDRRAEMRTLLRDCLAANRLNLSYSDYQNRKDEDGLKAELEKKQKIESAKKLLEEYGEL